MLDAPSGCDPAALLPNSYRPIPMVSTGAVAITATGTVMQGTIDATAGGTSMSADRPYIYVDLKTGTRVDVVATQNASTLAEDMTSKFVLSNVEVLTAGTRLEHDSKDGKPMKVTFVTLFDTPDQAERLTLASTEGKIQLAMRTQLESPETGGIRPGMLMGTIQQRPAPVARRSTTSRPAPSAPLFAQPAPTVEIIRGDKRQHVNVG
jgi:hypothetical protein